MPSPPPARAETTDARCPSADSNGADALVPRTAQKIAALLSDLKRELEASGGTLVEAHGTLHLTLNTPRAGSHYTLRAVSNPETVSVSVAVQVERTPDREAASANGATTTRPDTATIIGHSTPAEAGPHAASSHAPTRRASDAELERELISRKRRRLDEGADADMGPGAGTDDDDEDMMPLITKQDLESIVAKLRDDIQEDTSDCVSHVQKLLRRFKEEWHEQNRLDFEPASNNAAGGASTRPGGAAFPSPGADQAVHDITVPELVKQESKLISSQIRWLEECRRVAAETHDKREENWRTSSANFHDKARQDRESFQGRLLHESGMHSQMLNQILNEVKAIGLYAQSMKWETPSSLSMGPPYHSGPTPPAFPTQPPPGPPTRGRGKGFRGR